MYKIIIGLVVFVFYSFPAVSADLNIVYVNVPRLFNESKPAVKAIGELEKELIPRRQALETEQKRLEEMGERLEKNADVMSTEERLQLEQEILSFRSSLARKQDQLADDVNLKRNLANRKLKQVVLEAIQKVIAENQYDLVLGEGVLHAKETIDITDVVLKQLEK